MEIINKIPNLKVVTLNIWGIRYISKDVGVRINHLIEALNDSKTDYDIIALQEVWSQNDYANIKKQIASIYPFSHYFQSGLVGSGCCIFSKFFIEDVFHHTFTLNGYPHKIHHGDWYAGKCVGMARIRFHSISVNVYTTHLHANYSRNFKESPFSDEYLGHRMTQLFELSQFIHKTSHTADFAVLMGDLNTEDFEDGFKLLMQHANLQDAFKSKTKTSLSECPGVTCHSGQNCYQLGADIRKSFADGLRIDFILFKSRKELSVECMECKVCFGKIPLAKNGLNYSDHEGVSAEFEIQLDNKEILDLNPSSVEVYEKVKCILDKSFQSIFKYQLILTALLFISLVGLFQFNDSLPNEVVLVKNLVLTILAAYLVVYCFIIQVVEKKHLNCTLDQLQVTIDAIGRKIKKE